MKEAFEKIKERLEKEIFVAELYGGEWNGQTVDNLLCLGNVADVISEVEEEYGNGKTNADRIRAMSDEELAEFLIYSEENYKLFTSDGKDFYTYEEALTHEIEWLKPPTTD